MDTTEITAALTQSASTPTTLEESLRKLIQEQRGARVNLNTAVLCRSILRAHDKPLSASYISELLTKCGHNCAASTVNIALERMPDAYIKDWATPARGRPYALWTVVHVPRNAPPPSILRSVFIR